jgi:hypothetical protein
VREKAAISGHDAIGANIERARRRIIVCEFVAALVDQINVKTIHARHADVVLFDAGKSEVLVLERPGSAYYGTLYRKPMTSAERKRWPCWEQENALEEY